eukprot:6583141-Prymnesium_polylepis.1
MGYRYRQVIFEDQINLDGKSRASILALSVQQAPASFEPNVTKDQVYVHIDPLNGAVADLGRSDTPFFWRGNYLSIQIIHKWPASWELFSSSNYARMRALEQNSLAMFQPLQTSALLLKTRARRAGIERALTVERARAAIRASTSPPHDSSAGRHVALRIACDTFFAFPAYINYLDVESNAEQRSYFGLNAPRLAGIAYENDPGFVFRGGRQNGESVVLEAGAPPVAPPPTFFANLERPNYENGPEGMWCAGINAAGFDLDPAGLSTGGNRRTSYTVPSREALRYFVAQGANCFRLPITWERLQLNLGDTTLSTVPGFDEVTVAGLEPSTSSPQRRSQLVDFITEELGVFAIIDPHNNDDGLQHSTVDAEAWHFVLLWEAIARKWGSHPRIIFGLYNEPKNGRVNGVAKYFDPQTSDLKGEIIESWRQWMQAAIDAIR